MADNAKEVKVRIGLLAKTTAEWAETANANLVLKSGEMGIEYGSPNRFKIGDGEKTWSQLGYWDASLTSLGYIKTTRSGSDSQYNYSFTLRDDGNGGIYNETIYGSNHILLRNNDTTESTAELKHNELEFSSGYNRATLTSNGLQVSSLVDPQPTVNYHMSGINYQSAVYVDNHWEAFSLSLSFPQYGGNHTLATLTDINSTVGSWKGNNTTWYLVTGRDDSADSKFVHYNYGAVVDVQGIRCFPSIDNGFRIGQSYYYHSSSIGETGTINFPFLDGTTVLVDSDGLIKKEQGIKEIQLADPELADSLTKLTVDGLIINDPNVSYGESSNPGIYGRESLQLSSTENVQFVIFDAILDTNKLTFKANDITIAYYSRDGLFFANGGIDDNCVELKHDYLSFDNGVISTKYRGDCIIHRGDGGNPTTTTYYFPILSEGTGTLMCKEDFGTWKVLEYAPSEDERGEYGLYSGTAHIRLANYSLSLWGSGRAIKIGTGYIDYNPNNDTLYNSDPSEKTWYSIRLPEADGTLALLEDLEGLGGLPRPASTAEFERVPVIKRGTLGTTVDDMQYITFTQGAGNNTFALRTIQGALRANCDDSVLQALAQQGIIERDQCLINYGYLTAQNYLKTTSTGSDIPGTMGKLVYRGYNGSLLTNYDEDIDYYYSDSNGGEYYGKLVVNIDMLSSYLKSGQNYFYVDGRELGFGYEEDGNAPVVGLGCDHSAYIKVGYDYDSGTADYRFPYVPYYDSDYGVQYNNGTYTLATTNMFSVSPKRLATRGNKIQLKAGHKYYVTSEGCQIKDATDNAHEDFSNTMQTGIIICGNAGDIVVDEHVGDPNYFRGFIISLSGLSTTSRNIILSENYYIQNTNTSGKVAWVYVEGPNASELIAL